MTESYDKTIDMKVKQYVLGWTHLPKLVIL